MQKVKKKSKVILIISVIAIAVMLVCLSFCAAEKEKEDAYYEAHTRMVEAFDASGALIDECSALLLDVWDNAIFERHDERTDKYVYPNGVLVEDFNEALENLYSDEEFAKKIAVINDSQQEIRKCMKQMENPPAGTEEANEVLMKVADKYVKISMLTVNPSGSYNDVSEKFNSMSNEMRELSEQYKAFTD